MKKFKTISTIVIGLFIGAASLTSCEKVVDETTVNPGQTTDLLKSELVFVSKTQWVNNQTCQQADFACSILKNDTDYEWIKVYERVKKDVDNPDIWRELSYNQEGFTVEQFKIFLRKPCDWIAEDGSYRVELKLKENSNLKSSYPSENGIVEIQK